MVLPAQHEFTIDLKPIHSIPNYSVQSYAYGQWSENWIIIGGRNDGLHRRQPWATFNTAGFNSVILIYNPLSRESSTLSLSGLNSTLRDQLASTNMQFIQLDNILYLFGGYGYDTESDDHITFPSLIAVDLDLLINLHRSNGDIRKAFRQIEDERFQLTGGRSGILNDKIYLVGGQKFMGRYNPMGPDHGPGFIQQYQDGYISFNILDNGKDITIQNFDKVTERKYLHKRDYNLLPQLDVNGRQFLTAFSGVFKHQIDLPFLHSVTISGNGYEVDQNFRQLFNHYHSAAVSVLDKSTGNTHNLFFGGIAQFYNVADTIIQDDNVPFVNTVSDVIRNKSGKLQEWVLPVKMPDFIGASSEFIPNPEIEYGINNVLIIDSEKDVKSICLGYIFGGINSSGRNIFWDNEGDLSRASNVVYQVILNKKETYDLPVRSFNNDLDLNVYFNNENGVLHLDYTIPGQGKLELSVYDEANELVLKIDEIYNDTGLKNISRVLSELQNQKHFLVKFKFGEIVELRKVLII